ncbi:hypothetical protein HBI56_092220 [Parastagonospora nodorum]|uniref:Uncharacterized protein n=1 Tax=Phaeosphaeria nodorum (strain SN15 / ATCC MYA-4574 / FGSC 10173) TaxID=321614 RepID=A0A7U2F3F0_PHANO|nr:hypothetical protein HBH56_087620 [Parastagonospora nodorum]QRC97991.1 hypothetical protein JI435_040960 [Parastagonospora nodorum SN15]KAH3936661.1 hypothetical protein HBH54_022260 [Parastagonospora nodorum]KAH3945745.1 hypothetical protein HBH53_139370 [Parastagonospora nodorum]KAH3966338.1 hypothetical protein HBH51_145980 [Parastagonospora nodorum]
MSRDPQLRPAVSPTDLLSPRENLHRLCSMPSASLRCRRALAIAETIIEYTFLGPVFHLTWLTLILSEQSWHYVKNLHIAAFDIFDAIGTVLNRATKREDFPRLAILLGTTTIFVCAPSITVLILMFLVACVQSVHIKELEAQSEVLKARLAGKAVWPVEEEWDVIGSMD